MKMRQIKYLTLLNNLNNKKNESKKQTRSFHSLSEDVKRNRKFLYSFASSGEKLNERRNSDNLRISAEWLPIGEKNDALSPGCRGK